MFEIEERIESRRGCGYRKPGGLYLVSGGMMDACGRLPIPLDVCPTCSHGIKPSRGWTWVNGTALAATQPCAMVGACSRCPLGGDIGRVGLLWIGERFYARPEDFTREAVEKGVSRRVTAIPREFKLGETWILVAHRKAIRNPDDSYTAAVFHAYKPDRIEYVVKDDDPEEKLERLVKRGITLLRVIRDVDAAPLLEGGKR